LELAGIEASGLFASAEWFAYRWDQRYTTDGYAALLRSYSDMLAMEPDAREALIRDLCRLADERFGGRVLRPLVITLTMARKGGEAPGAPCELAEHRLRP
jgi:hypothetical protein